MLTFIRLYSLKFERKRNTIEISNSYCSIKNCKGNRHSRKDSPMKNTDPRLSNLNLKGTRSRQMVLSFLDHASSPATPEEIFFWIKRTSRCSLSTVYRILNLFCEHGLALRNTSSDGKSYYQINSHSHSHNLICKECHKTLHVPNCPMHKIEDELSRLTNYKILSHSLEFIGICPECQKKHP